MLYCRLVLTVSALLASVAFAKDGLLSCDKSLRKHSLLRSLTRKDLFEKTGILGAAVLQIEDRARINELFAKATSTADSFTAEDFLRLREVYFEARLSNFSPELAAIVRLHPVKINFAAEPTADQNGVTLPEEFADTLVPTLLWAHELEHVIQFALLGMYTLDQGPFLAELKSVVTVRLDPRARYWGEYAAMLGEWEILSVVPMIVIEQARVKINAHADSGSNRLLKSLKTQLNAISTDVVARDSYVATQHAAGRYSVMDFSKVAGIHATLFTGAGAGLIFAYNIFCGLFQ